MTSTLSVDNLRAVVDELKPRVLGQLLLPGAPGFDDARSVWNAMIDRRPGLIVRCLGVADVVAGVNAARTHGLPLSIKGGGHNIAGLAVCEGGLMLDLSLMRGVWVDPAARRARAQAGCLLGDVDRETQLHGLAAVLGFVSATGCAGLTLGGGFGYLTRRFGWTSDNLASVDVVTADGRLVRASAQENSDLFWGLRGGGGNFGVVTSFEYMLHPVGPEIVARRDRMARRRSRRRPRDVPLARRAGAARADVRRRPARGAAGAVALRPTSTASRSSPSSSATRVRSPTASACSRRSRASAARSATSCRSGRTCRSRSCSTRRSRRDAATTGSPSTCRRSIPHCSPARSSMRRELVSPHSAILIFPLGGALNDLPEDHSAVGNRDAAFVLNIAGAWERADDDAANIAWARSAWSDLRRFSSGGTYINFLTEDDGEDRTRAAYRGNYDRLAEIKARWDPANLFRANKNIPAAVGSDHGLTP